MKILLIILGLALVIGGIGYVFRSQINAEYNKLRFGTSDPSSVSLVLPSPTPTIYPAETTPYPIATPVATPVSTQKQSGHQSIATMAGPIVQTTPAKGMVPKTGPADQFVIIELFAVVITFATYYLQLKYQLKKSWRQIDVC